MRAVEKGAMKRNEKVKPVCAGEARKGAIEKKEMVFAEVHLRVK